MSGPGHTEDVLDEEPLLSPTSTLADEKVPKQPTPLPKLQIAILMVIQFAEPISATCILPFINQMIRDFDVVGGDDAKLGYFVGLTSSLFYATEALTVLHWSRLSDRIGRKPVLLIGLAGLAISMSLFGLCRNFWLLVLVRCICGVLNGNTGVSKSCIGDLTDSTNRAQVFALMPVIWATGGTIAPYMGGVLSRPAERFPALFESPFWRTYPYFLPCVTAAGFTTIAFLVALIFFKETLPSHRGVSEIARKDQEKCIDSPSVDSEPVVSKDAPVPLRMLIKNRNVVVAIANYGVLALLDIAYAAFLPLFYATPIALGGLGLDPPTIGIVLGSFGFINGFFQVFAFAPIVKRCGLKNTFTAGMSTFIPLFTAFPVINFAATRFGGVDLRVWPLVALQLSFCLIMDMSYSSIFVYVTSAAPNKRTLGATNGLAQVVASTMRAIGPAISTSLFAMSVEHHWLGGYAGYIVLILMAVGALRLVALLPKEAYDEEGV